MKVLVIFAHPVETSFCAALYKTTVETLKKAGHQVDACDLYAEDFNPVLSREERVNYHDLEINQKAVESYVNRLNACEALVIVTPVWNFGYPAILKGFFDRVFLPGVSFEMVDKQVKTKLTHIKKLAVVTTYGGTRLRAFLVGDPPRTIAKRLLRASIGLAKPVSYLAQYDMNRISDATRARFLAHVASHMENF